MGENSRKLKHPHHSFILLVIYLGLIKYGALGRACGILFKFISAVDLIDGYSTNNESMIFTPFLSIRGFSSTL